MKYKLTCYECKVMMDRVKGNEKYCPICKSKNIVILKEPETVEEFKQLYKF